MKREYGELRLGAVRQYASRTFLRMEQEVKITAVDGEDIDRLRLFGVGRGTTTIIRTLLYEIPNNITLMEFEELVRSYPQARIIRQLSHEPIISPSEREFVNSGLVAMESIARRQLIRDRGTVYTDRYGMAVYAQNRLSLNGEYGDQDQRIVIGDAAIESDTVLSDLPIYTT